MLAHLKMTAQSKFCPSLALYRYSMLMEHVLQCLLQVFPHGEFRGNISNGTCHYESFRLEGQLGLLHERGVKCKLEQTIKTQREILGQIWMCAKKFLKFFGAEVFSFRVKDPASRVEGQKFQQCLFVGMFVIFLVSAAGLCQIRLHLDKWIGIAG